MSHTPGPWIIEHQELGATHDTILAPSGSVCGKRFPICEVFGTIFPDGCDNACLIAAAPDLLAACKALIAERAWESTDCAAWDMVRSAISKAEGRP